MLKKYRIENQNLNNELLEKNQMIIREKEELMLNNYGSGNEELLDELKNQICKREENYGK